jgi:hypothetical protein
MPNLFLLIRLICRTKFPIKALPVLKSLASDLQSIPLPQTIAPPPVKERSEPRERSKKRKADEVIVVD